MPPSLSLLEGRVGSGAAKRPMRRSGGSTKEMKELAARAEKSEKRADGLKRRLARTRESESEINMFDTAVKGAAAWYIGKHVGETGDAPLFGLGGAPLVVSIGALGVAHFTSGEIRRHAINVGDAAVCCAGFKYGLSQGLDNKDKADKAGGSAGGGTKTPVK